MTVHTIKLNKCDKNGVWQCTCKCTAYRKPKTLDWCELEYTSTDLGPLLNTRSLLKCFQNILEDLGFTFSLFAAVHITLSWSWLSWVFLLASARTPRKHGRSLAFGLCAWQRSSLLLRCRCLFFADADVVGDLNGFTGVMTEEIEPGLLKYEYLIFEFWFFDTDAQSLFKGGPASPDLFLLAILSNAPSLLKAWLTLW